MNKVKNEIEVVGVGAASDAESEFFDDGDDTTDDARDAVASESIEVDSSTTTPATATLWCAVFKTWEVFPVEIESDASVYKLQTKIKEQHPEIITCGIAQHKLSVTRKRSSWFADNMWTDWFTDDGELALQVRGQIASSRT